MSPNDLAYYGQRAARERAAAEEAADAHTAEIHLKLACIYDKLVELDQQPPPPLKLVEVMRP